MTFDERGGHHDDYPQQNYTRDEDHDAGVAIEAATGEVIGVRDARKKQPRGTYVCSKCLLLAAIEGKDPDHNSAAVRPVAGEGTMTALHFRHYKHSAACRQRGETAFHAFFSDLLASEIGGQREVQYPGTKRRADVYDPVSDTYHEIVVSSDVRRGKSGSLRPFYEAGGVIYKYYPGDIDDREKMRAINRYKWDRTPGSGPCVELLRLLVETRRLYVPPKEPTDRSNNSDKAIDGTVKTIQIENVERCGPHCANFEYGVDGLQVRMLDGYCRYGAVSSGAPVKIDDLCAVRNKKGALREHAN